MSLSCLIFSKLVLTSAPPTDTTVVQYPVFCAVQRWRSLAAYNFACCFVFCAKKKKKKASVLLKSLYQGKVFAIRVGICLRVVFSWRRNLFCYLRKNWLDTQVLHTQFPGNSERNCKKKMLILVPRHHDREGIDTLVNFLLLKFWDFSSVSHDTLSNGRQYNIRITFAPFLHFDNWLKISYRRCTKMVEW